MYYIGDLLNWKLWEKPVHIIVIEHVPSLKKNDELFKYIRDVFICQNGKYTQNDVAMRVIEQINENTERINQLEQYIGFL
jgi:hypothetical protein